MLGSERLRPWVWVIALAACSPPTPSAPAPLGAPSPASPSSSAAAPASLSSDPRPATSGEAPPSPDGAADDERYAELRLVEPKRVIQAPIHSLAIHPEKDKVAALGDQPWLYEGESWRAIELPEGLRAKDGERDEARIHFGRDDQPRIMGTRFGPEGPRQLYLRFRFAAWREDKRELGSFAQGKRAALYGLLGWADPEVVCKVGDYCLIKQRSGWSQVPLPVAAPKTARRIDLAVGGVYALLERRLLRLEKKRWAPIGAEGPWQGSPAGAWIDDRTAWVSAPDEDGLYQQVAGSWQRHPSPVRQPRGLWASRSGELWIAGQDGVGYFDGQRWWRSSAIPGPVHEVIGHRQQIWFAGPSGLWVTQRPASP